MSVDTSDGRQGGRFMGGAKVWRRSAVAACALSVRC